MSSRVPTACVGERSVSDAESDGSRRVSGRIVMLLAALVLVACGEDTSGEPVDDAGAGSGDVASDARGDAAGADDAQSDAPPAEPPDVDRVDPPSGLLEGGEQVSILGENFVPPCEVLFGGSRGRSTAAIDADSLSTLVPPSDRPGPVDVDVSCRNGDDTLRDGYTYISPNAPALVEVDPPLGWTDGGEERTIRARNLPEATSYLVAFGGRPASDVVRVDAETMTCITPAHDPGVVGLTVDVGGEVLFLDNAFTFIERVTLDGVEPDFATTTGGARVAVLGAGLLPDAGLTVLFGERESDPESYLFVEEGEQRGTRLTVTVPAAEEPGLVDLSVRTAIETTTLEDAFAYVAPIALADEPVEPSAVSSEGGQRVALRGSGFDATVEPLEVTIAGDAGEDAAADVTVESSTEITFLVPPLDAGEYDVTLVHGRAELTAGSALSVFDPIEVREVLPARGPADGGTRVEITGRGFVDGAVVLFGAEVATSVAVASDGRSLAATTPPGDGTVDVTVRTPFTRGALPDAFTYED